jgi:hypothetical protein
MNQSPFEVRVSFAWWLRWVYLPGVMTMCLLLHVEANPERMARVVARATRVRIVPKAKAIRA